MKFAPLRLLLLCAAASSVAVTAFAQVSGKLLLGAYKPAPAASERPAYNWELENGFKEVKPDRVEAKRELAVVLLGDGEPLPGLDRLEVTFYGGSLLPATIAARTGATVLLRNDDEIAHELYAEGLEGFSAEPTSPRGRRSVNLTAAGSYKLRDKIVPHVTGHLHVLPNLIAVATPENDGQFSIKVPAGKYELKVLHGEHEIASRPIELTGNAVTLDPITLTAEAAGEK
jgi:hypothetical protein